MPQNVALLEVVVNQNVRFCYLVSMFCKLAFRQTTVAITTATTTIVNNKTTKTPNNHTLAHTEYQSCFQHCRSWTRLTWRCPPLRRTNLGWCPSGVRGVIHKCTSSNRIMALVNQPQIPQKTYGADNALGHAQTM